MTAFTIGFGDYYPVTEFGRWIITFTFYVEAGLAGVIIGIPQTQQ